MKPISYVEIAKSSLRLSKLRKIDKRLKIKEYRNNEPAKLRKIDKRLREVEFFRSKRKQKRRPTSFPTEHQASSPIFIEDFGC